LYGKTQYIITECRGQLYPPFLFYFIRSNYSLVSMQAFEVEVGLVSFSVGSWNYNYMENV